MRSSRVEAGKRGSARQVGAALQDRDGRAGEVVGRYAAPAVEKALDILECLSEEATPLAQADIARALDRQPGELFRMLMCLERRGYLYRNQSTGKYALTLKLFELSRTHSPYEELLDFAVPRMRALSDAIRESCHLCVLHGERVVVLAQTESPEAFRVSVEVGSMHSAVATTSGRLLLASMEENAQLRLLGGLREFQGLTRKERLAFLDRLAQIRRRGFEFTEGERFVGGVDFGALVGCSKSRVKAALTVATLSGVKRRDHEKSIEAVVECARLIASDAGVL